MDFVPFKIVKVATKHWMPTEQAFLLLVAWYLNDYGNYNV
jgi:hypothetical protein